MKAIIASLNKRTQIEVIVLGVFLVLILGWMDFKTGSELSFSVFYLLPVSLEAWFVGRKMGILTAVICAVVWFLVERTLRDYSNEVFPIWNAITRFGFFAIVTFLLSELKNVYEHEKNLARTDFLTGASNSRYFAEVAELELMRVQRYHRPLSVVFVDLDNFKSVNDRYGHAMGDRLLQAVCQGMQKYTRKTDLVARLGGDEFVILLPETGDEQAQAAIERMRASLQAEMETHNWPVTCSIGLAIYYTPPTSVDEMLKKADSLAYLSKEAGKNTVHHEIIGDKPQDIITQPTKRKPTS